MSKTTQLSALLLSALLLTAGSAYSATTLSAVTPAAAGIPTVTIPVQESTSKTSPLSTVVVPAPANPPAPPAPQVACPAPPQGLSANGAGQNVAEANGACSSTFQDLQQIQNWKQQCTNAGCISTVSLDYSPWYRNNDGSIGVTCALNVAINPASNEPYSQCYRFVPAAPGALILK
jgi:hypothetical protein